MFRSRIVVDLETVDLVVQIFDSLISLFFDLDSVDLIVQILTVDVLLNIANTTVLWKLTAVAMELKTTVTLLILGSMYYIH